MEDEDEEDTVDGEGRSLLRCRTSRDVNEGGWSREIHGQQWWGE